MFATIKQYIDIIIGVIILVVGLSIGYTVGNWHTENIRSQLETLKDANQKADKAYKDQVLDLGEKNASLQERLDNSLKAHQQALADAQAQFDQVLAQKNQTIASLQVKAKVGNDLVVQLQQQLANAKTQAEKDQIQSEIKAQQEEVQHAQDQVVGLQCLSAQVPDNLVDALSRAGQ